MIDLDQLEEFLLDRALRAEPVTYQGVLHYFERPHGPVMVRALCHDLGKVSDRLKGRGIDDIACLVVRKSDGLPGKGYFGWLKEKEDYNGPDHGPMAKHEIERRQEVLQKKVCAFFGKLRKDQEMAT